MITLGRLDLHLAPGTAPEQQAALRRQATSALGYAALAPRALPPHAVLVVRRLPDPLPGDLLSGSPWQAGGRWGEAARAELARMWRSAARPAHGPVPPDAAAVWFADPAEWLACLSLDLYRGVAHLRWWWRIRLKAPASGSAVPARNTGRPLSALWQAEARSLPAALAYLHEHSPVRVAAIFDKLPPHERQAVLRSVLRAHALPPTLLDQPIPRQAWESWVPKPEAVSSRSPQVESGAALVLAAWYAPAALRRYAGGRPSPQGAVAPVRHHSERAIPADTLTARTASEASADAPTPENAPPPIPVGSNAGSPGQTPAAWPAASLRPQSAAPGVALEKRQGEHGPHQGEPDTVHLAAPPSEPSATTAADTPISEALQEHGLATGLGGVWLLVNLLIALDQIGGLVSPWLKLEALARRLLAEPLDDDPLWGALAELQGRERTPQALEQTGRWLAGAWAQIEAWLLERLESKEVLVLERRADCYLTPTHIDVVFAIDEISLPLRLIGLDRDPGWVPELARVIHFHFE